MQPLRQLHRPDLALGDQRLVQIIGVYRQLAGDQGDVVQVVVSGRGRARCDGAVALVHSADLVRDLVGYGVGKHRERRWQKLRLHLEGPTGYHRLDRLVDHQIAADIDAEGNESALDTEHDLHINAFAGDCSGGINFSRVPHLEGVRSHPVPMHALHQGLGGAAC